ncbi:MAG: hypothetical protein LV468_02990 [Candidatus Nitrosotenuis sp.]|nr:hypothetical protein [Candidatus Nitrosotenuis cloacae]MDC8437950.1 hypothetical protein [Candidatus Nitrosotenuis sp.]
MRCENCGELLREPKLQTHDKTENGKTRTEETTVWTCSNCDQIYSKTVAV